MTATTIPTTDNKQQHEKISGYRTLTPAELDAINEVKAAEYDLTQLCDRLATLPGMTAEDMRWLDDARMAFQKGCMSAVRAIAKPLILPPVNKG